MPVSMVSGLCMMPSTPNSAVKRISKPGNGDSRSFTSVQGNITGLKAANCLFTCYYVVYHSKNLYRASRQCYFAHLFSKFLISVSVESLSR